MTEKLTKELSSLSLSRFISLIAMVASRVEDSKNTDNNLEFYGVLDKYKLVELTIVIVSCMPEDN